MTWVAPLWASTSRSKRASALGPTTSLSTRLPAMPSFRTPIDRAFDRRRASWSGHRWFASGVESVPSVIESPNATTAPTCVRAEISTADRKNHACVVFDTGKSVAPAWLPAAER